MQSSSTIFERAVAGESRQRSLLIGVGDVHGHLDRLNALWAKLEAAVGVERLHKDTTVVFLGDYCDRGPDTKGVIDRLVQIASGRPDGRTVFLAGNHDFAFAAYVGSLPGVCSTGFDLDATKNPKYTTGFWPHMVEGGMHYQGRRWGGSATYHCRSTFASYGISWENCAGDRVKLIDAMPDDHKQFLKSMHYVYEQNVVFDQDGEEGVTKRVLCVHAGLSDDASVEEQIESLRRKDFGAPVLQPEHGRLEALCGRIAVSGIPETLKGSDTIVMSGHHGYRSISKGRIILDRGGGGARGVLEAIVLPSCEVISHNGECHTCPLGGS